MKNTFRRDTILIIAVIVVFAAAYFIFQEKPVEQTSTGFKHPDVAGMTMGDTPEMDKFIADLPKKYGELIGLGNNYMDQGMYALAIECYQRALAIDSTDPNVMIDLGACFHTVGGGEKAIGLFEKALAIKPDHVIGHFNSGIVYRELGNFEMATRHWEKVVELDSGTPMADSSQSYITHLGHDH